MSEIKVVRIHAGEREERTTTTGTKAWELFADDAEVIAARVATGSTDDATLRDLSYELQDGDEVAAVAITSQDGLDILRHSTAHVMAQAVQELFPDAKLGIGPPVENGFYYDFQVDKAFQPDDLDKLEKRMQQDHQVGAAVLGAGGHDSTSSSAQGGAEGRAVQAGARST